MLDIKFIVDNKDIVKEAARKKAVDVDIDRLLELDLERKTLLSAIEAKRQIQNDANNEIASASDEKKKEILMKMKLVKDELQNEEAKLKTIMVEWRDIMLQVPNVPDMSVPEGKSDEDNKEIKKWGEIPEFSFKPKGHVDLMMDLDMVDFERGVKIVGFRGYFLKGDGALLSFALWNYARDFMMKKGGFTPMLVPSLVRREAFLGTGYLPQSEEDLYKTQDESYLSGTAEVPTMGFHMDEVIEGDKLPLKFLSFSPCYRREAGSYGQDTKGLMRVHEFMKLEQVILCEASHEESVRLHEELQRNSEELVESLGIPYHVVLNCAGDLGLGQVKKYDIETWVPSEDKYRETHSCSYFHDFQTRRLNTRYRDKEGKMKYVHSLNNTAIATPRFLISLIENNQQEDGSIKIPPALVPYFGKDTISKKN